MRTYIRHLAPLSALLTIAAALPAQSQTVIPPYYPEDAHVNLFFTHLANGGTGDNQWQSTFLFNNPTGIKASVHIDIFDDNGNPLAIDLGSGLVSFLDFTIEPFGSRVLRGTNIPATLSNGWAQATSNTPLQAAVLYTWIRNGSPVMSVTSPATLPATDHWFVANGNSGFAFANLNSNSVTVTLNLTAQNGTSAGTKAFTLAGHHHTAFNLNGPYPDLNNFNGSVHITSSATSGGQDVLALGLNVDRGTVASLPPGRLEWPVSHYDAIWDAYLRIWNAALEFQAVGAAPDIANNIDFTTQAVNASYTGGSLHITAATSELMSDSPSELAFVIAHEIAIGLGLAGHGNFSADLQQDADAWAMLLMVTAGYDPYASAGALAKINLASQSASVASGFDLNTNFATRLANLNTLLGKACNYDTQSMSDCNDLANFAHPNFSNTAPAAHAPRQQTSRAATPRVTLAPSSRPTHRR